MIWCLILISHSTLFLKTTKFFFIGISRSWEVIIKDDQIITFKFLSRRRCNGFAHDGKQEPNELKTFEYLIPLELSINFFQISSFFSTDKTFTDKSSWQRNEEKSEQLSQITLDSQPRKITLWHPGTNKRAQDSMCASACSSVCNYEKKRDSMMCVIVWIW